MDSRLERYISYEYLVSPCPESGRNVVAENRTITEVSSAIERAKAALQSLRTGCTLDEQTASRLAAVEQELSRASALLENAADKPRLA
jgi:hypothetical protein